MASDDVNFSRTNRVGEPMGELRLNIACAKLAVLDSVAISETRSSGHFISRTELVDRILSEWIQKKVDEAILICNSIEENPTVLERK